MMNRIILAILLCFPVIAVADKMERILPSNDIEELILPGGDELEAQANLLQNDFDRTFDVFVQALKKGDIDSLYALAHSTIKNYYSLKKFRSSFAEEWKVVEFKQLKSQLLISAGNNELSVSIVMFKVTTNLSENEDHHFMVWKYESGNWLFSNFPFSLTMFPPSIKYPKEILEP